MPICHKAIVLLIAASAAAAAAQSQPETRARLGDRCADVRLEGARDTAIAGHPDEATASRLLELLKSDPFPDVRLEAASALGHVTPLGPLASSLIAALDDSSPDVAGVAAGLVGTLVDDARSAPRLVELLEDPGERVRHAAQNALTALVERGAATDESITRRLIAALSRELRDPAPDARNERINAVVNIGRIRHPDTVPVLIAMMQDPTDVRLYAWGAIRKSKDPRFVGPLITVVQSAAPDQGPGRVTDQLQAAAVLGDMKDSGAVAALCGVLRKPNLDAQIVTAAVTALGDIGSTSAEPCVRPLLTSPSQKVRYASIAALPKLVDNTPPRTVPAAELRMPSVTELVGPPVKLWPGYGFTVFTYEIPEAYHGFLTIDYQTPGCPPLHEADGRTLIRFDKNGYACTSTGRRIWSRKDYSLAYRVGGGRRTAIALETELSESAVAPLPATARLPSRATFRVTMFAGTKAELRAARGCVP